MHFTTTTLPNQLRIYIYTKDCCATGPPHHAYERVLGVLLGVLEYSPVLFPALVLRPISLTYGAAV